MWEERVWPIAKAHLGRAFDDDFEVLTALCEIVTSLGYDVRTAAGGAHALAAVPVFQPDVILLDLAMPAMSGTEVLARIHRDRPNLPVIVVAAKVDSDVMDDVLARGAFVYVGKPFDVAAVGRAIVGALEARRTPG